MSKWYEVVVGSVQTIVVEVVDEAGEEEAQSVAFDEAFSPGDDKNVEDIRHLNSEAEINDAKRRADEVITL